MADKGSLLLAGTMLLLGYGSVCQADTNLLLNPSFESHPDVTTGSAQFIQIPGWSAPVGSLEILMNNAVELSPADGEAMLHLDTSVNSAATQSVVVEPGQHYGLDLLFSGRWSTDINTADIDIYWNDELQKTLTSPDLYWQSHHLDLFSGPTDISKLTFISRGTHDGIGGLIDFVQLYSQPYQSGNFIANGSFENVIEPTDISDWLILGEPIPVHSTDLVQGAAEGTWAVSLNNDQSSGDHPSVQQSVDLDKAVNYELSLSYSQHSGSKNTKEPVAEIRWNDTLLDTLLPSYDQWERRRFDLQGIDGENSLLLSGLKTKKSVTTLMDNVRLYATCRTSENLVANGSFEIGNRRLNGKNEDEDDKNSPSGWSSSHGNVWRVDAAKEDIAASESARMMMFGPGKKGAVLGQLLQTTPGRKYELTLDVAAGGKDGLDDSIRLWWSD